MLDCEQGIPALHGYW